MRTRRHLREQHVGEVRAALAEHDVGDELRCPPRRGSTRAAPPCSSARRARRCPPCSSRPPRMTARTLRIGVRFTTRRASRRLRLRPPGASHRPAPPRCTRWTSASASACTWPPPPHPAPPRRAPRPTFSWMQHLLLAAHDLGLHVRRGGLALEHLAPHLRLALRVVGALQLVGDLLVGLRLHQLAPAA